MAGINWTVTFPLTPDTQPKLFRYYKVGEISLDAPPDVTEIHYETLPVRLHRYEHWRRGVLDYVGRFATYDGTGAGVTAYDDLIFEVLITYDADPNDNEIRSSRVRNYFGEDGSIVAIQAKAPKWYNGDPKTYGATPAKRRGEAVASLRTLVLQSMFVTGVGAGDLSAATAVAIDWFAGHKTALDLYISVGRHPSGNDVVQDVTDDTATWLDNVIPDPYIPRDRHGAFYTELPSGSTIRELILDELKPPIWNAVLGA